MSVAEQSMQGAGSKLRMILVSVLVPLFCLTVTAAVMSIPANSRGINLVAGREAFRAHCGACHFAKMGFPAHHGPNLHDIGRTGATRKPNMTAPQYILESILEPAAFVAPGSRPGMPRNMGADLSPEELRNLVGFLASCGAFPDYGEIAQMEIPDRRTPVSQPLSVSRERMVLAENVLQDKGGCLECHSRYANPDDRIFAPALFNVGMTDRRHVHESLLHPSQVVTPRYECVTVELTDGTSLSGQVLFRDPNHLVLCQHDQQGRIVHRKLTLSDIETDDDGTPLIQPTHTSLMPTGFDKLLKPEELDAVEVLIHQLN